MEESSDYESDQHSLSVYPEIHSSLHNLRNRNSAETQIPIDPAMLGEFGDAEVSDRDGDSSSHRNKRRRLGNYGNVDSDDPEYEPAGESAPSEDEMEYDQRLDDESHDAFLPSRGRGRPRRLEGSPRRRGPRKGPRKALEPSLEFKNLHSEATSAFIDSDYDRAVTLVKQAIQINPEIFAAHSLLSEIFLAQGHKDKALAALFSGAHTRPRDPDVWLKVANLILDRAGDDRPSVLPDVLYCYSRIVEVDPQHYDVRFERAAIYRELGHIGRAVSEYEKLYKELSHNMTALRQLAEICIDTNEIEKAKDLYEDSILHYMSLSPDEPIDFTWSDVNIYIEFFSYQNDYEQGVSALKFLARWMLGRRDDSQWDDVVEDDREWDADDFPRRADLPWFVPGQYPLESYGTGLPLELRVKLGSYRLKMGIEYMDEALAHFAWLNPEDQSEGALLFDYGDLFRDAADTLKEAGLYQDALRFYVPLQLNGDFADTSLFMAMAECHVACDNVEEAENCYLTVVEYDEKNVEVRTKLANFYAKMEMLEQALKYATEALEVARRETIPMRKRRIGSRIEQLAKEFQSAESGDKLPGDEHELPLDEGGQLSPETSQAGLIAAGSSSLLSTARKPEARRSSLPPKRDHIRYLYSKLLELQPAMRAGDEDITEDWLDIADAILRDFRANRVFFPVARRIVFQGYSREAERKAGRIKTMNALDEMEELVKSLQKALGSEIPEPGTDSIPTDYHGISFDSWLDVFLEYALVVAGQGQMEEAYETLSTAASASVWHHSKSSTRQIHVCWFTCAIRFKDENTLADISRWFMKEYQFVTDAYRLFAALSRLCGEPRKSLFHASPSMKFMLRQIKAIDYTLPDEEGKLTPAHRTRASVFQERAALTTRDESGNLIPATNMDVALLVLYGHILYAGTSYTNALNYFFRAYALDPENHAVLLSIGLSYIHHALKRQSDNRHYYIMQGLSFMEDYRRVRSKTAIPQEKQEVEFNFARVWHMLGLAHLAVEGYQRCLDLSGEVAQEREKLNKRAEKQRAEGEAPPIKEIWVEDFSREAAYALQCLYSLSGDTVRAKTITEKWLVM